MARAATARRLPLVATLVLVAVVLGLGPLAALAAALAPVVPAAAVVLPGAPDPAAPRTAVRELPAGLTPAQRDHPSTGLRDDARAVLGRGPATAFLARLERGDQAPYDAALGLADHYPSRYPWVQHLLDTAPDGARTAAAVRFAAVLVASLVVLGLA